MMALHCLRWTMLGLIGLTVTTSGCSRWIDILTPSTGQAEFLVRSVPHEERVAFVLDGFRLVRNGAPQDPSLEAERRFLNSVRDTRLFSPIVPLGENAASLGDKTVTARLTMEETIDPRSGATAWKGFIIGASMFLLAPMIELDYGYALQANLELERWDGQVTRYEARSAGTVRYHLFGATPIMLEELKGQVTEACLDNLMGQLVRDTDHYTVNSSPPPDPAIRTVTVRVRKSANGTSAAPAVPISVPPSP
jgi:hypothetical protein